MADLSLNFSRGKTVMRGSLVVVWGLVIAVEAALLTGYARP